MLIAFVHPHKSFIPELDFYSGYFRNRSVNVEIVTPDQIQKIKPDVEWHIMGTDYASPKNPVIKIHEYSSASVPPLRKLKNYSKKIFNTKPSYRIFLNEYVRSCFGFQDDVPFGFRDMGIPEPIVQSGPVQKEYDFIYTGSLAPQRKMDVLFDLFCGKDLAERSLLVLSANFNEYAEKYRAHPNIRFEGPVSYRTVASYILKARFGLNFIPDREPYNRQSSTKFLEYAACGIPVITTSYEWIRSFQKEYGGAYFYLEKEASNFTWKQLQNFKFASPDLRSWTWEEQIRRSGVVEFLRQRRVLE